MTFRLADELIEDATDEPRCVSGRSGGPVALVPSSPPCCVIGLSGVAWRDELFGPARSTSAGTCVEALVKMAVPRLQEAECQCPRTGPGAKPEIPDWLMGVLILDYGRCAPSQRPNRLHSASRRTGRTEVKSRRPREPRASHRTARFSALQAGSPTVSPDDHAARRKRSPTES